MRADYTDTLDTNFEPIGLAAESVVSRLAKARWRALAGDRYGLIRERRKGDGRPQGLNPSPPFYARTGARGTQSI